MEFVCPSRGVVKVTGCQGDLPQNTSKREKERAPRDRSEVAVRTGGVIFLIILLHESWVNYNSSPHEDGGETLHASVTPRSVLSPLLN